MASVAAGAAAGGNAAAAAAAAPLLGLFRSILRLHRQRLPPPMRSMGDTYVKSEFRRHLQGKTSDAQWASFVTEWRQYSAMLGGTADQLAAASAPGAAPASVTAAIAGSGGGDMTEALLEALGPDQRRQLIKLQQEALSLGVGMIGKPAPFDGGGGSSGEGAQR